MKLWNRFKKWFNRHFTADEAVEKAIVKVLTSPGDGNIVADANARVSQRIAIELEREGDYDKKRSIECYKNAMLFHRGAIRALDLASKPLTVQQKELQSVSKNILNALEFKLAAAKRFGLFAHDRQDDVVVFYNDSNDQASANTAVNNRIG